MKLRNCISELLQISCWVSANIKRWAQTELELCKKRKHFTQDKYCIGRRSPQNLSIVIYSIATVVVVNKYYFMKKKQ